MPATWTWTAPARPRSPAAGPSRSGYACFRRDALPIIILIADAPSHNGPTPRNDYDAAAFLNPATCPPTIPRCQASRAPHSFDEAMGAVNRLGARVIGINSGTPPFSGRSDLERLARDTGAVTSTGSPQALPCSAKT